MKEYISGKDINKISFSNLILNQKNNLKNIEKNVEAILITTEKIKLNTNINNKKLLVQNRQKLLNFKKYINIINNNFETFLNISGHNKKKKYLIVFQNNDEIRPT
jgi:hypothetical protein